MEFSLKPARNVDNPVVEPAWGGLRVLVLVAGTTVEARDAEGTVHPLREDLTEALIAAVAATGTRAALLDGHLNGAAVHDTVGVGIGLDGLDQLRAGDVGRQMLLGGSNRRQRQRDRLEANQARREVVPQGDPVALVAIDLLWIDDQPLLDVPLLERKRLLEASIAESNLVRRSVYVRPPMEAWYGQWRGMGFHEVAVRDANSRYRPGERTEEWATALIPRR